MTLTDLVAPNAVIPALKVNSKKQAIQELAARAAGLTGQNEKAILEILLQREKLGSTAVGNGVAIPHGKLPKLGRLFGLFARLPKSIDFEALDNQPVDLVFLLLAPEAAGADHLKALARVARQLRDPEIARRLRELSDADALYAVLAMPPASTACLIFQKCASNVQASMNANCLELVAPCIRDRGLTRIGEHDRRAVRCMQREQLDARLDFWRLREQVGDVF